MDPSFHHYNLTIGDAGPVSNSQQQNSANQGMTAPFFFLIVLVAVLIIFFFCNSPCFRRLVGHSDPLPPSRPRRPRLESTESDVETGLDRFQFVKSNLPYRKVEIGDEETGEVPESQNRSIHKTRNSARESRGSGAADSVSASSTVPTRSSLVSQQSSSRIPICSICLSSYHNGDEVAYSTNPSCQHEYHRECIQDWLMSHEECPLCRNVFLPKDASTSTSEHSDSTVSSSTELEDARPSTNADQTTIPPRLNSSIVNQ